MKLLSACCLTLFASIIVTFGYTGLVAAPAVTTAANGDASLKYEFDVAKASHLCWKQADNKQAFRACVEKKLASPDALTHDGGVLRVGNVRCKEEDGQHYATVSISTPHGELWFKKQLGPNESCALQGSY